MRIALFIASFGVAVFGLPQFGLLGGGGPISQRLARLRGGGAGAGILGGGGGGDGGGGANIRVGPIQIRAPPPPIGPDGLPIPPRLARLQRLRAAAGQQTVAPAGADLATGGAQDSLAAVPAAATGGAIAPPPRRPGANIRLPFLSIRTGNQA